MNPVQWILTGLIFAAGGIASGLAFQAYDRLVDDPAIRKQMREQCELLTRDARREAELAERKRQQEAASEARRRYEQRVQANELEHQAQTEALEDAIAIFEANERARRAAAGVDDAECAVTDANIGFLRPGK